MMRLGETKLALDEAVAGDVEESDEKESVQVREVKMSLMNSLRKHLEEQELESQTGDPKPTVVKDNDSG